MIKSVQPADIESTVKSYSNILFKLCFTMLANRHDAEDAVQDTMLRYIEKAPPFRGEEHKKAWLLRVAVNVCRDKQRFFSRYTHLDEEIEAFSEETDKSILESMLRLPDKYKSCLHLHYVEGYKTGEIAEILGISPDAVRKRLQSGRRMLKIEYERDEKL